MSSHKPKMGPFDYVIASAALALLLLGLHAMGVMSWA